MHEILLIVGFNVTTNIQDYTHPGKKLTSSPLAVTFSCQYISINPAN